MTLAELFSSFRRPQSVRQALLWGVLTVVLIGFVAGLATVGYLLQDLPPITGLHEYQPSLVTRVYSADKQVIGQFFETADPGPAGEDPRSEEHTSELQSRLHLVCRLLLEKKKN